MFRQAVKSLLYDICWIATSPLWLTEKVARRLAGRDVCLVSQSQLLSLFPGKLGQLMRNAYYQAVLENCPYHVCFQFGCLFAYSKVRIGRQVYLGLHSKVGLVDIGDRTIISDDVQLLSGAHQHSTAESLDSHNSSAEPEKHIQPGLEPARISIGRDTWVGTRAIVMADIGNNCIIGAGSIVTRPIPSDSVAVGAPARVLRTLTGDPQPENHGANAERDLASAGF